MKNLIRIAAISGSILLGASSFAQETPQATPTKERVTPSPSATMSQPGPATPKPRIEDGWKPLQIGTIIKQVGLTPEQSSQAKELNARYQRMYNGLPADMPLEDRKAKVKSMMAERETEMKAMLTAEQAKAYGEMRTPSGAPATPKATQTAAPTAVPEKQK